MGSASMTTRHNRLTRLISEDLRKAARDSVIEPTYFREKLSRPDVVAIGSGGGDELIDVSVIHPIYSLITIKRTIATPSIMLRQM